MNPFFSPGMLTFIKHHGCILAVPNIRGGGEFGEEWHLGGIREKKINVFDDFIAARCVSFLWRARPHSDVLRSEYLVTHKYSSPGKIAINGGSNGGLLVAACVNIAPKGLFRPVIVVLVYIDTQKYTRSQRSQ